MKSLTGISLHQSRCGITNYDDYKIESCFGRNIMVIKFAETVSEKLEGTIFE